jgi:hypothetical protein
VSAAWDYIHVGKNRREHNLAELAYVERRIKSAARRLRVTLGGKPAISSRISQMNFQVSAGQI